MTEQNLNGRLCQIVDELVRRGLTLEQARREFERLFIVTALKHHDGNVGRSARSLGVHRNTLRNKVSNLKIEAEEYSARARSSRRKSTSSS